MPVDASRDSDYSQILSEFETEGLAKLDWWKAADSILTRIAFDKIPGIATFSLHRLEGNEITFLHSGPEGRRRLRSKIDPTPLEHGQIGRAIRNRRRFVIVPNVDVLEQPSEYVAGRSDTRSELVALIPGPLGEEPIGAVNFETNKTDAFSASDGAAVALVATWLGVIATDSKKTYEIRNLVKLFKGTLTKVEDITPDEEKKVALLKQTEEFLNHLISFDALGIVSVAATRDSNDPLVVEHLSKGYALSRHQMEEFCQRKDTFTYALLSECMKRPKEVVFRDYDVAKDLDQRYNVKDYRSSTRYCVGIGVTYDADARRHLGIILDFDQYPLISAAQGQALETAGSVLGLLLTEVETRRQSERFQRLRKLTWFTDRQVLNLNAVPRHVFLQTVLGDVREVLHANACGIFLEREAGEYEAVECAGSESGEYWALVLKKHFKDLRPTLDGKGPSELFVGAAGHRLLLIAHSIDIDYFRRSLFVSFKEVERRPDVRSISLDTRDLIRAQLPAIEQIARYRSARGESEWLMTALNRSVTHVFDLTTSQDELIAAAHEFVDGWLPVGNPYSAVFFPVCKSGDEVKSLRMTNSTFNFLRNRVGGKKLKKIHENPLELRLQDGGLTVDVWNKGPLLRETAGSGSGYCKEWWDGITSVSAGQRMFVGAQIVDIERRVVGVITLNGPRSTIVVKHPENVSAIRVVIEIVGRALGASLARFRGV